MRQPLPSVRIISFNCLPFRAVMAVVALALLAMTSPARAQIRIVTYNVADLAGDQASMEDVFAALNLDDKPGFATTPHVYVFQEVGETDFSTLRAMVNAVAPPGVLYTLGTHNNFGEDPVGGAQAVLYRADKLFEETGEHADIFTGAGRFADRWKFRLVGYTSPDASFYIYSAHLKAGNSASDVDDRHDGVIWIRNNADALPQGTHIVYAGDFNFSSSNEVGYVEYFSGGAGHAVDPLGTGSWGGARNAIKHSQSPRTQSGPLIGGGMDDRFDFQLVSDEMNDADGLSIIPGTYRSLGNDGQHFDDAINDGNNFYYPGELARSNALADDLHDSSDHIPVVADIQVPAIMFAALGETDFGRVIQGASLDIELLVLNFAVVEVPEGSDLLEFTAVGAGSLSGVEQGSVDPAPDIASVLFPVDTSVVGPAPGTVSVLSFNQAVENGSFELNTTGEVVRASRPSFSGVKESDSLTLPVALPADSGVQDINVSIHNFEYDAAQARLDVDSVDPVSAPFGFAGGLAAGIGSTPAVLGFTFDTTGILAGAFETTIDVQTSDEDLPGEGFATLTLTLQVTVGDGGIPEDLDGDGDVDAADLATMLGQWGVCPGCPADLDGNGVVDAADLATLLGAWG